MEDNTNVIGTTLLVCGNKPKTGYFRDGNCSTGKDDRGLHTVCAVVTDEFLIFSKSMGNDLMTPVPAYDFPGLKAGDHWCLCASRWKEAYLEGVAPPVILEATHAKTLEIIGLEVLLEYACNLPGNA